MLPAISVGRRDLQDRYGRVKREMAVQDVRAVLGGQEFKTEERNGSVLRFWRFRLLDADLPSNEYEIYMAEFHQGRVVEAAVLPQG